MTLMKVYLPAIKGHVPDQMVQAMHAFLEFSLEDALRWFHCHREIFRETGARTKGFDNLPRQHSLIHYMRLIQAFGAPNGLCSSITESKHIKAMKEPWQHSNRFEVLAQMLLTNQCLDKLAASHVNFTKCGMLEGTCLSTTWEQILRTRAAADHILPHSPDRSRIGKGEVNDDEDSKVAGSTVEASTDLGKKSMQSLPRRYGRQTQRT
ncbi:hypothetical protein EI94DRAFT_1775292 [Lactarius quietus]|nr:hypothetical protein EI94DRAFT_1775292 [Lactarius quietus]